MFALILVTAVTLGALALTLRNAGTPRRPREPDRAYRPHLASTQDR